MTQPPEGQDRRDDIARLEHRLQQLASLMEVSRLVGSSLDLGEVLDRVMRNAQDVVGAEAGGILLMNERTGMLEIEVALGAGIVVEELKKKLVLMPGQGITGAVALSRMPELVPDTAADPRFFREGQQILGITIRSMMAAPMTVHDRLVGVAVVFNARAGARFTPADLEVFTTYCHQVAVAIENARLHGTLLQRDRELQQLELAALVQQTFLPKRLPTRGHQRLAVEAQTVPAAAVAGDLYDVVERRGNRMVVLIGDVSGKGFPAALMMAKVISDFRAAAHHAPSPAAILGHLNTELVGHSPRGMFVTAACLSLGTETGQAGFASAGHLPPLWYRGHDGTVGAFEVEGGPPLGIVPRARYPTQELLLEGTDTLLLYTDGIVEELGGGATAPGLDRLAEVMRTRLPGTRDLVGDVLGAIRARTGDEGFRDDLTLVALRWGPSG